MYIIYTYRYCPLPIAQCPLPIAYFAFSPGQSMGHQGSNNHDTSHDAPTENTNACTPILLLSVCIFVHTYIYIYTQNT